jgi:hypothetical protein
MRTVASLGFQALPEIVLAVVGIVAHRAIDGEADNARWT